MSRAGVVTSIITLLFAGSWIAFEFATRTDDAADASIPAESSGVDPPLLGDDDPVDDTPLIEAEIRDEISSAISPTPTVSVYEIDSSASTATDDEMSTESEETASGSREGERRSREIASGSQTESATGTDATSPPDDSKRSAQQFFDSDRTVAARRRG